MRRFFASAFGLSLTATLALGAAFAWTTTGQIGASNEMGYISIEVPAGMSYNDNIVYDGAGWIPVSYGSFKNTTPANPGVNLHLTGGSVEIADIVPSRACDAWMSGKVDVDPNAWAVPGGGVSGTAWVANLRIDGSPNECQGAQVNYYVNLIAGT